MVGFHALHDSRRYTIPRCLGPSHPDTKARCAAMMIRLYKPRDSARSALLTAVRSRRSGLAVCTPEGYYTALRPLTGAAKYACGAHEHVDAKIDGEFRLRVAHVKVRRVADR